MKPISKHFLVLSLALIISGIISSLYGQSALTADPTKINRNDLTLIYDGRESISVQKMTDAEKSVVEKELRDNEDTIKRRGKIYEIKCDTDAFKIVNFATGSFTSPKAQQKVFLYQLCSQGSDQNAVYLGGIIITENNKIIQHQIFGNIEDEIRKYNDIKSLPDLNKNGLSKIVLEYSNNTARTIEIYELHSINALKLATIAVSKDKNTAYKIFVKPTEEPIFYRESYELANASWQLKDVLQKTDKGESVYPRYFRSFSRYEASGLRLTAEDISTRIIKLIKGINGKKDISPQNIERLTGIKMLFDPKDANQYSFQGHIDGTLWWVYWLSAYPYPNKDNKETDTLRFSFEYQADDRDAGERNLQPVCSIDFDNYNSKLKKSRVYFNSPLWKSQRIARMGFFAWRSFRANVDLR